MRLSQLRAANYNPRSISPAALDALRAGPAVVRFVSYEPALGPLQLDLSGIHWVIYGGESGPQHRPDDPAWARAMRDACAAAGVAFFFKQQSGRWPGRGDRLYGKVIKQWPKRRRVIHAQQLSLLT